MKFQLFELGEKKTLLFCIFLHRWDEQMFIAVTTILRDRQIFNEAIWSYSLKHFSMVEVKEYLSMQPKFLELIAPGLDSSVLTDYDAFARVFFFFFEFLLFLDWWNFFLQNFDQVDKKNGSSCRDLKKNLIYEILLRQAYQIMEYWPLTSPRAHYHEFNNDFFAAQYLEYLKRSFYRSYSLESMTPAAQMTGVYYFLIQVIITLLCTNIVSLCTIWSLFPLKKMLTFSYATVNSKLPLVQEWLKAFSKIRLNIRSWLFCFIIYCVFQYSISETKRHVLVRNF